MRNGLKLAMAFGLVQAIPVTAVSAQATRTWISGTGDDANPCSRTAPCKTFPGAISKTAAGGEINVIDSGGYGAVTITKSITLRAVGAEAGILVAGTNGITIIAGPSDKVVLDGLEIDGGPTGSDSLSGVSVRSAGDVLIRNCLIRNFGEQPSYLGNATAGVQIGATSGQVRVTIENSTLANNVNGVVVACAAGTGHGKIYDTSLVSNATAGVLVVGAGNNAILSDVKILGSSKALDFVAGGGAVTS
jgi:hypothetical protein